jgi:capsular polysaccharide biosynthesis protein
MNETPNATAIFAPIWRRKWLILAVAIVVAGGTYEYYKRKPGLYAVKTQIYLGAASEGQALLNNTLGKTTPTATALANQVQLIQTSIGEAVHQRLRKEHNAAAAKGKAKAKTAAGSDFISITAEARTAKGASDLANAYAQTYIKRHQANYERSVNAAISTTRKQMRRIELAQLSAAKAKSSKGGTSSGATTALQVASLNTKLNQLEADLTVVGVQQIGVAKPARAELIAKSPKKNAIFGFVIGLLLASLAVYIVSRFDRRLRSLGDIDAAFQGGF